jgi:putative transposase
MPWMETAPVEQRERFIRDHRLELYAMAELCGRYGISRKTGYKWLARFDEGGRLGLHDRSRAPRHCPHRIARAVAAVICAARRQHPTWGPAKLLTWLQPRHPGIEWPAVSTAGDLLARRGLVKKRRRRR